VKVSLGFRDRVRVSFRVRVGVRVPDSNRYPLSGCNFSYRSHLSSYAITEETPHFHSQ